MRNATILMVRLNGVATEAIKNIVLAGIGKLIVVDPDDVTEQELGAGFFYRDEDVGKKVSSATPARPGTGPEEQCDTSPARPCAPCSRAPGGHSDVNTDDVPVHLMSGVTSTWCHVA